MKKVLLSVVAVALLACIAIAQPAQCRVNATIYKPSGAVDPNFTLTVFRVVLAGSVYSSQRQVFRTNASGVLLGADNTAGVSLPQGSVVWLYANAPGFDYNPNSGTAFQIPNTSTAQLTALTSATTIIRALGDLVVGGVDGIPTRLPAGVNGRCLVMVSGIPTWAVCPGGGGGGSSVWGNITGTLIDQTDLQSALNLKANTSALAAVALSGAYNDLTGKPTLGTAAALNVAASGNAASGEVVKGNDTRLSDSRTPTSHTHAAADTISGLFNIARIPDLSSLYSVLAHTHTFASLTSKPTTLSGYGIVDAQSLDSDLTAIAALTTTSFGRGLLTETDAASARGTLGLVIGTNVQAYNADLAAIAGLTPTNDDILQRKAGAWTNRTVAQFKTDLGLATIATSGSASDLGTGTVPLARLANITNTEISASAAIAYSKLNLTGAIVNGDLAGSIANNKLTNSSITIAGSSTSLGGSITASTILDSIGSTRGSVLYRGASGWAILTPGTSGHYLQSQGSGADPQWAAVSGSGDVVGPSSSVDNEIPRFDSTTGKLIQASGVTISDLSSNAYTILASSPTQGASATAGSGFNITASPAIAGNTNAGAAAGGAINFTTGSAARLTSGTANGGDGSFVSGASIGGGTRGTLTITFANLATQGSNLFLATKSNGGFCWTNSTTDIGGATCTTALGRVAEGVVKVGGAGGAGGAGSGTFSSTANTPTQITADQNNYAPGIGWFQRWSSDASRNVTGLTAGSDGQIIEIWNVGSNNIVLINESASSTAANRFTNSTAADITLSAGKCAEGRYDNTSSRWRMRLCN